MAEYDAMELQELDAEIGALADDFEDLTNDFDEESMEALSELDTVLAGSGLDIADSGSGDLNALTDDPLDAQFLGGWLKKKVAKLIRKIVALVRRYKSCASCVPKVTKAVSLFKRKKYAAALRAAYDAYRCIRRCIKR